MNRVLLYALLAALVFVRALPLHGHWHGHSHVQADDQPGAVATQAHHHAGHSPVHSHIVNAVHEDTDHDTDTVEINLLGSALARDIAKTTSFALISTACILLLAVLWICVGRQPVPAFLSPFTPLLQWRPSPRAPPR